MCAASKIADDWIVKGCHIHVDGVELVIFTNHFGSIDFRPFFSTEDPDRAAAAIKKAWLKCLPDPDVRKHWMKRLDMARGYMMNYKGIYAALANGRMFDFKMIRIAISRWTPA